MTVFASTVLAERGGQTVFRVRLERHQELSTAKRAAFLYWRHLIDQTDDIFQSVSLVSVERGTVTIHSRPAHGSRNLPWTAHKRQIAERLPAHLTAALRELGVDLDKQAPPLPETLEINGRIYRLEI